ncbi:hypothetical protein PO909_030689 [Leuciscus waleckii]
MDPCRTLHYYNLCNIDHLLGAELCHLCGMRSELGLCSADAASSPHPGGIKINQIPEKACRFNLRSSAAQEAIDSEAQHG